MRLSSMRLGCRMDTHVLIQRTAPPLQAHWRPSPQALQVDAPKQHATQQSHGHKHTYATHHLAIAGTCRYTASDSTIAWTRPYAAAVRTPDTKACWGVGGPRPCTASSPALGECSGERWSTVATPRGHAYGRPGRLGCVPTAWIPLQQAPPKSWSPRRACSARTHLPRAGPGGPAQWCGFQTLINTIYRVLWSCKYCSW